MPVDKAITTFQRRFLVLDAVRRLSYTGNWVTQPEIVRDLKGQGYAVEKHHVLRDLKALAELFHQLECNDNSRGDTRRSGLAYGYRWVGKDVVKQTGLAIPEALSLVMVERYLKQALPSTLTRALDSWFEKARNTLRLQSRNEVARWTDKICIVQPTQPLLSPQIPNDVLNVIHEAVLREEQVRVQYRSSGGEPKKLVLHPLGLIQRGPASYLVALAFDYDDVLLYALHRIASAERFHEPARKLEAFNLKEYADEQGHFGTGRRITLKARISPSLATILSETPLSEKQTLSSNDADEWRVITARVKETWQLHWWVLSQGEDIEILRPKSLRAEIKKSLLEASNHYEKQALK